MTDQQMIKAPHDEAFELCDREDEEQILAEIAGRVADKYIYEVKTPEGPKEGLSYAGVNWACREYAKRGEVIRISGKPDIIPDPMSPEHIIVSVLAQRFAIHPETSREVALDSVIGCKRQWIKMEKRDGSIVVDRFYVEKAVSKAQRNAKAALIPTEFVKEIIKRAKGGAGKAPAKQEAPTKPPVKPERTHPAEAAKKQEAAPKSAAPTSAPAKQEAPASGGSTVLRQRVHIMLGKVAKSRDEQKRILHDLTAFDSTKDVSDTLLEELIRLISGVLNKTHMLRGGERGWEIATSSGEVVLPIFAKEPGEPEGEANAVPASAPEGEEMF